MDTELVVAGLPRNLLHKFGHDTCHTALDDPSQVERTWSQLDREAQKYRIPRSSSEKTTYRDGAVTQGRPKGGDKSLAQLYDDLGRYGRGAIYVDAGPAEDTPPQSHTGSEHTGQLLQRLAASGDGQASYVVATNRLRKDDFTDWNERRYVKAQADKSFGQGVGAGAAEAGAHGATAGDYSAGRQPPPPPAIILPSGGGKANGGGSGKHVTIRSPSMIKAGESGAGAGDTTAKGKLQVANTRQA